MNINKYIYFLKENSKHRNFYIGALGLAVFFIFVLFSDHGLGKRVSLEMRKSELYDLIENQEQYSDSLRNKVKRLKSDTLEIERIAREKYGMVKPGERVFIIRKTKSE